MFTTKLKTFLTKNKMIFNFNFMTKGFNDFELKSTRKYKVMTNWLIDNQILSSEKWGLSLL